MNIIFITERPKPGLIRTNTIVTNKNNMREIKLRKEKRKKELLKRSEH